MWFLASLSADHNALRCGRASFSADHNALRCKEPRFQQTRMQCALPQFETALFKTAFFEAKRTTEKVNTVILLFRVSTLVQVSASA